MVAILYIIVLLQLAHMYLFNLDQVLVAPEVSNINKPTLLLSSSSFHALYCVEQFVLVHDINVLCWSCILMM